MTRREKEGEMAAPSAAAGKQISPFRLPVKPVYSMMQPFTQEMQQRMADLEASHMELRKRMQRMAELEASHEALKRQLEEMVRGNEKMEMRMNSAVIGRNTRPALGLAPSQDLGPSPSGFVAHYDPFVGGTGRGESGCNANYVNILQSMGQALYIFSPTGELTYWNRMAEQLYGYTAAESLGHNVVELLCPEETFEVASRIVTRLCLGECWTGQFPLRKKSGEIFTAMISNTPLCDENGKLVGVIGVSSDARPFREQLIYLPTQLPSSMIYDELRSESGTNFRFMGKARGRSKAERLLQPWHFPFASSLSNLASFFFQLASPLSWFMLVPILLGVVIGCVKLN